MYLRTLYTAHCTFSAPLLFTNWKFSSQFANYISRVSVEYSIPHFTKALDKQIPFHITYKQVIFLHFEQ